MTVPFTPIDPERRHRGFGTDRDDPEPRLSDMLGDPTLHALMARDGIDRSSLERLIAVTRRRLRLPPSPAPAKVFESALLAECGPA